MVNWLTPGCGQQLQKKITLPFGTEQTLRPGHWWRKLNSLCVQFWNSLGKAAAEWLDLRVFVRYVK